MLRVDGHENILSDRLVEPAFYQIIALPPNVQTCAANLLAFPMHSSNLPAL